VNRRQALAGARRALTEAGIAEASLEGEVLLRHALGTDRAGLFASPEAELTPEQATALTEIVRRRSNGEPAAYITGHREFYGLDFKVNRHVLIPRPETELLVEKTIEIARNRDNFTIADIGTGCGAIAVSLAVHLPQALIYATDISPQALEVARENAAEHGVADRITFLQGNLLEPLPGPVDLIIANLPYVRREELTPDSQLAREPALALDGGEDGLTGIRALVGQTGGKLKPGGAVLVEVGLGQSGASAELLRGAFPGGSIEVYQDLSGIARAVALRLT
jgi:release factor glutamine methyltransferase